MRLRAWSVNSSGPASIINLSSPTLPVWCLVSQLLVSATVASWAHLRSFWALHCPVPLTLYSFFSNHRSLFCGHAIMGCFNIYYFPFISLLFHWWWLHLGFKIRGRRLFICLFHNLVISAYHFVYDTTNIC